MYVVYAITNARATRPSPSSCERFLADAPRHRALRTEAFDRGLSFFDCKFHLRAFTPPLGDFARKRAPRLEISQHFEQFLVGRKVLTVARVVGMRQRNDHSTQ